MIAGSQQLFFVILAISAGAAVSIQAGINASLGTQLNNSLMAATISFGVGFLVALLVLMLSGGMSLPASGLKGLSPLLFTGGALGVLYVTSVLFLVPKIGISSTITLVVAGQLGLSVMIGHYSLLGVAARTLDGPRIVGIVLVVVGTFLIIRRPV